MPILSPAQFQEDGGMIMLVFLALFAAVVALFVFILFAKYFNLWIQSKTTNANIGLIELIGMTLRKVSPNIIVRSKIMAVQAGLTDREGVTRQNLESHYLAGGNVPNVIRALIAAQRADIPLTYKRAAAIDLGRPQRARGPSRRASIPR